MNCRTSITSLIAVVCFLMLCRCAHAQSATFTTPTSGSNLHCVVQVQATYTLPAGDTVASGPGVRLYITDNTGARQDVSTSWMATNGTASYSWDTSQTKNGNVTLGITIPYTDAQGNAHQATNLGIITVNVQNGYVLAPGSCVATITVPTQGSSLPANGQSFSITSNHTVAWTRNDDCQTYYASYRLEIQTTYQTTTTSIVADTGVIQFPLPKRLGIVTFSTNESWHSTVTGPTPAQYQNYALTYGQDSNVDATLMQGASNGSTFSVVAP